MMMMVINYWYITECVCVCVDSVSVLRAHKLRVRLSVGVLSVSDMPGDDWSWQHVSTRLYVHHHHHHTFFIE